ncbi:MAG: hypothetical protein M3Z87_16605, partial [Lactobacillus sp.]|nr:hypothetical protein [Lactobacillus sp.]
LLSHLGAVSGTIKAIKSMFASVLPPPYQKISKFSLSRNRTPLVAAPRLTIEGAGVNYYQGRERWSRITANPRYAFCDNYQQ